MEYKCKWYLSDGSVLRGKTAAKYLHTKLKNYERLIEDVDCVLSRSLKSNHIVEENTLANTVMSTGETLSIIQIELELLLERMSCVLEDS